MHELAITESILAQAISEACRHKASSITRIRLQIGELTGIVPECVQFYFEQLRVGTVAAEAELFIQTMPVRLRCPKCGRTSLPGTGAAATLLDCECQAGVEILSGQELLIEDIEITTDQDLPVCQQ